METPIRRAAACRTCSDSSQQPSGLPLRSAARTSIAAQSDCLFGCRRQPGTSSSSRPSLSGYNAPFFSVYRWTASHLPRAHSSGDPDGPFTGFLPHLRQCSTSCSRRFSQLLLPGEEPRKPPGATPLQPGRAWLSLEILSGSSTPFRRLFDSGASRTGHARSALPRTGKATGSAGQGS